MFAVLFATFTTISLTQGNFLPFFSIIEAQEAQCIQEIFSIVCIKKTN
jgi:hypothetical protein